MVRQAAPLGCLAIIPIGLILLSVLGLWAASIDLSRHQAGHGFFGDVIEPWQAFIFFGVLLALGIYRLWWIFQKPKQ